MRTIHIQVKEDHLETIGKTRPLNAIVELIWNALDAEAKQVQVRFIENELSGLDYIDIIDDGNGLQFEEALISFSNLGGSWKRGEYVTPNEKRILHGKYGKGRFRAFSLGNKVSWKSIYRDGNNLYCFYIKGDIENLSVFEVSEPEPVTEYENSTGMYVRIALPNDNTSLIRGVLALEEITDIFAPYLMQYPNVKIIYDGISIDPQNVQKTQYEYPYHDIVVPSGKTINATLTIVEWNTSGRRGLLFCDENGFARFIPFPRLHFRGFSYTAYFKSEYIKLLDQQGLLQADELCEDVRFLTQYCKKRLREHFILREAEKTQLMIEEWKDDGIYPITPEDMSNPEKSISIKIFDIYATHLFQMVRELNDAPQLIQKLTLKLLYTLIQTDSNKVAHILNEIISLPEDKETEIQRLLI
ncbi:MAG TPA: ATP-binding protein [Candidatus Hydrogenedens sp.]|nr:ATP-binding protein [Candidatus Hydrogenedens sp.]